MLAARGLLQRRAAIARARAAHRAVAARENRAVVGVQRHVAVNVLRRDRARVAKAGRKKGGQRGGEQRVRLGDPRRAKVGVLARVQQREAVQRKGGKGAQQDGEVADLHDGVPRVEEPRKPAVAAAQKGGQPQRLRAPPQRNRQRVQQEADQAVEGRRRAGVAKAARVQHKGAAKEEDDAAQHDEEHCVRGCG